MERPPFMRRASSVVIFHCRHNGVNVAFPARVSEGIVSQQVWTPVFEEPKDMAAKKKTTKSAKPAAKKKTSTKSTKKPAAKKAAKK
jgi:hypothetical protein